MSVREKLACSREEMESWCHEKAMDIYGGEVPEELSARLTSELDVIFEKDCVPQFMVAKFVADKAKADGRLIGFRGTEGCSLVAFLLGITDINPIENRLPGCVLYGPDYRYMPRFMLNLPNYYRKEMIAALREEYGLGNVHMIAKERPENKDEFGFVGDVLILDEEMRNNDMIGVMVSGEACLHPVFWKMYGSKYVVAQIRLLEHDGITMIDRLEKTVGKVSTDDITESQKWDTVFSLLSGVTALENTGEYKLKNAYKQASGVTGIPECENLEMREILSEIRAHSFRDLMEAFYNMRGVHPKSHALEYALMMSKLLYYKLYHPLEFYAANYTACVWEYNSGFYSFDTERLNARIEELDRDSHVDFRLRKLMKNYNVVLEMRLRGINFAEPDESKMDDKCFNVVDNKIMPSKRFMDGQDGLPFNFA